MRILVTGGAGYIGSVVAAQLVAAGHEVVVYDNLSKGNRDAVPPRARLIVGDVGDRACLDAALRAAHIDFVMHFAAWIEAGESMKEPERFFRNNTANALVLLEAILAHHIPRLVFSSTAALYGNPLRSPIGESDPLQPTNAYVQTPRAGRRWDTARFPRPALCVWRTATGAAAGACVVPPPGRLC